MAEKRCDKCGEIVDEAKAFCPGCGDSFVDEKQRTTVSDFDQSKRTVQLGETMFNQMLSEMGLNISKQPGTDETNTELITPLVPATASKEPERKTQEPSPAPSVKRSSSRAIKIALILFAAAAFLILVMLVTVAAL